MAYAPGVIDQSGQILGQAISQAGSNIGDFLKQRKEEQKQIQQDAKGFDALYNYAEKSGNKELLAMLVPQGGDLHSLSARDKAMGLKSGIEAFKVGSQVQQLQAEQLRAKTAADEIALRQREADLKLGGQVYSPLLGGYASPSDATGAANAFAQLLAREVSTEDAIRYLGGNPSDKTFVGNAGTPMQPLSSDIGQKPTSQVSPAVIDTLKNYARTGGIESNPVLDYFTGANRKMVLNAEDERKRAQSQISKMSPEQLLALSAGLEQVGLAKAANSVLSPKERKKIDKMNGGSKDSMDASRIASNDSKYIIKSTSQR